MTDPLLRLPEVIEQTGRKRSSIYEDMARGEFPKPVKIALICDRTVEIRTRDRLHLGAKRGLRGAISGASSHSNIRKTAKIRG